VHWFDGDIRAQAVVDGRTQKPLNCVWASGQGFTQTRPLPVGASQPVVDVNPVARHPECDKAIALGSQVLLIGGASGIISAYSPCLGRAKFIRSPRVISCSASCLTPDLFL